MAHFYGGIQGNRGEATRMGSKDSGFTSSCQSWSGSVITRMWTEGDTDCVGIDLASGSTSYGGIRLLSGDVERLVSQLSHGELACFECRQYTVYATAHPNDHNLHPEPVAHVISAVNRAHAKSIMQKRWGSDPYYERLMLGEVHPRKVK